MLVVSQTKDMQKQLTNTRQCASGKVLRTKGGQDVPVVVGCIGVHNNIMVFTVLVWLSA